MVFHYSGIRWWGKSRELGNLNLFSANSVRKKNNLSNSAWRDKLAKLAQFCAKTNNQLRQSNDFEAQHV